MLLLHAAAGSNKLDTARSLDLLAFASSYKFTEKMKSEGVSLLEHLEAWVDKQAQSLDLAQNTERISGNFDSLLKVLDSLYQVGNVGTVDVWPCMQLPPVRPHSPLITSGCKVGRWICRWSTKSLYYQSLFCRGLPAGCVDTHRLATTQRNQGNPGAGGLRPSLTSKIRSTPLFQGVPSARR